MELEEGVDQINANPNEASVVEEAEIDLDISVVLPIADVKTPEVRLFLLEIVSKEQDRTVLLQ